MDRICKIIVIEDDDSVRSVLGDILDYAGYDFTLAGNGAEMRRALDSEEYDVAIIDLSLRGGEDGLALAEVATEKGCCVILTTGDPQQGARLEASGRRHIFKPFRVMELIELIDLVLKDNSVLCAARSSESRPSHPALGLK